jgi:hypothetical protein
MGAAFERIERAKLLLGEGDEEVRFFKSVLKHLDITGIQVAQVGGKGQPMHRFLKALPSFSGFTSLAALGVTRDADDDRAGAFQSVCDGLRNAGLAVPDRPVLSTEGKPRVSVFILPDCVQNGMLETLCLQSVADDPAMKCVEAFFACVKRDAGREPENMWKARTHAWLASKERSDRRLGEAAEAGYWPFDDPAFKKLSAFLRSL